MKKKHTNLQTPLNELLSFGLKINCEYLTAFKKLFTDMYVGMCMLHCTWQEVRGQL